MNLRLLAMSMAVFAASQGAFGGKLASGRWWDAGVESSIDRAPSRKAEWESMLSKAEPQYREYLAYLVRYLPEGDLLGLKPSYLVDNVRLALLARKSVPWGASLPNDIFLDAVLPHACVTEPRDSMREELYKRYIDKVKAFSSPGEAAQFLNRTIFPEFHVKYDTHRLRTDQSPRETIAQGMATCTGLSILLVDACRAVGVPARLAGIESWPGRGGNHTWVEIWDQGWHFVGAAEPDPKGLDHAWFVGDAAKAIKDEPDHAIYAVTYRTTGEKFPLAWDPGDAVNAANVTDYYTGKAVPAAPRLMIEVRAKGERVDADVEVKDVRTSKPAGSGKSLGPHEDVNRYLSFEVPVGHEYEITVRYAGRTETRRVTVSQDTVTRFEF